MFIKRRGLPLAMWIVYGMLYNLDSAPAQDKGPAAPPEKLAADAVGLLEKYCHRCHGVEFKAPGLDMLDRATLIRPKNAKKDPYLVPGKPNDSFIWTRISEPDETLRMPPEKQPQPRDAEKALLKQWIEAGAPFPPSKRPQREFLGEDTLLDLIDRDLATQDPSQRRFLRYFSLAHLWNDPAQSDEDLRLVRAGVSKLMNSLSSMPRVEPPRAVGVKKGPEDKAIVLGIDLRRYGWTKRQWNMLLELEFERNGKKEKITYPYGLHRSTVTAKRVYELTGCELPYVRADWFTYYASRPPHYYELLGVPRLQKTLETELGVDARKNFLSDSLWRAAFRQSGVSKQNRMVERHDAKIGAYWPSYDFKTNLDRKDLFHFPLGPEFEDVKGTAAFKHDGGEIIYSLPNGLQAYMLVKGNGERIDEGPIDVVFDPNQFSGSPAIVNGVSCMGCHREGMIRFSDTLRATFARDMGVVADKVRRLYPEKDEMDKLIDKDRNRFLAALEESIDLWVRRGTIDKREISKFAEPVTHVTRRYDRKLSLADVARELGLPEKPEDAERLNTYHAAEVATLIKLDGDLRELGLTPLANGEVLPRDVWEKAFQRIARKLKLGVPFDVISSQ